jgi:type I pantothenate kinase
MDSRVDPADDGVLSPYRTFTREEWASLRADTPLTLTADDVTKLQSLNDPISLDEVIAIYLPLSRLLSLYVAATQGLFKATQRFLLAENQPKVPYIIGVAGSVAVGKSTTARVLKALLARRGLMERKGFPESYDGQALLRFLSDVKAGKPVVDAPVYSHLVYDVVPDESVPVERPDILILEGLNVLQPGRLPRDGKAIPFVSDFFDFSIYLDADEDDLHRWYINRFMTLRQTAFRDPRSYFKTFADIAEGEALQTAERLWSRINLPNLHNNILPTRRRSSLILTKGPSHRIQEVALRRL